MGSITLSTGVGIILGIAGALVTLQKAWEIIRKVMHPEDDLRKIVNEHSSNISDNMRRLEALERSLLHETEEAAEFRAVMCMSMQAQFDHELSGNDIAHIRTARDKLNAYLTNSKR